MKHIGDSDRQALRHLAQDFARALSSNPHWQPIGGAVRLSNDVAQQLSRPVTLDQIWIHALHRYGAVCVTIAALTLAGYALRSHRDAAGISGPAVLLIVLLVTQVALGSLVVLLRKPAAALMDVDVAYIGFDIANEFVVGYGLDYAERYRDLPYIGRLRPAVYNM